MPTEPPESCAGATPGDKFRHFFATFGKTDLPEVRKFMIRIMLGLTAIMVLVAATPIFYYVVHKGMGVTGEVYTIAQQAMYVLCLTPVVITFRASRHSPAR